LAIVPEMLEGSAKRTMVVVVVETGDCRTRAVMAPCKPPEATPDEDVVPILKGKTAPSITPVNVAVKVYVNSIGVPAVIWSIPDVDDTIAGNVGKAGGAVPEVIAVGVKGTTVYPAGTPETMIETTVPLVGTGLPEKVVSCAVVAHAAGYASVTVRNTFGVDVLTLGAVQVKMGNAVLLPPLELLANAPVMEGLIITPTVS
jgi:hypothetical protein